MTLADDDTNPILIDNAKRAIQGKLRNLVANFANNANGAILFLTLQCALYPLPPGDIHPIHTQPNPCTAPGAT